MAGPRSEWVMAASVLPGRVRWAVRGLRDDPGLARLLADELCSQEGVASASASAMSGRVLVEFDPSLRAEDLEAVIEDVAARRRAATRAALPTGSLALVPGGNGSLARAWSPAVSWALGREAGQADAEAEGVVLLERLLAPRAERLRLAVRGATAANVIGVLRIVPVAFAMNALAHGRTLSFAGKYQTVGIMSGVALAGTLLRSWLRRRSQIHWNAAARDAQHDLRMAVWERVQAADAELLEDGMRTRAMSILGEDVNECERGMDAAYGIVDLTLNTVIMGGALFAYSTAIGSVGALPIPVLLALAFKLHPKVQKEFTQAGEANAGLAERVGDAVAGLLTTRTFTQEDAEAQRIEEASVQYRRRSIRSTAAAVSLPIWLETAVLVGQLGTYVLNSHRVARGATVGSLAMTNSLTGHLLYPLTSLGPLLENMQRGLAAFERVSAFMVDARVEHPGGRPVRREEVVGEIDYRDVSFRYPAGQRVFDGLSLRFPASSWTGVVGPTGSGKSSLLRLLLRLYETDGGRILLDGQDIESLRRADLRQLVAVIPQRPFVFQRSIHDNIAFGCGGASRERVIAAATAAQAHEFIEALPAGYDTVLGKGGQGLSGGEQQRIAIARALLKDAPIVMLDEALASLDSGTEVTVQDELRRLFHGKTVVSIAHRLSSVRHADRIVVVERGRVVQEGTHDALVREPGPYQALWRSQVGQGNGSDQG